MNLPFSSIQKPTPPLIIAGFMSGTSLDGVDVSVIETDGHRVFQIYEELTVHYPTEFQEELRSQLGARELSPGIIQMSQKLMDFHAEAFDQLKYKKSIDLLSIHGQTLFHTPRKDGLLAQTWQVADPEYLQSLIHKPIVFDLRREDIVQGGEGAPLVPIYHLALARDIEKPVAFVNIGGVANITWISSPHENDMVAGDVGPGMALLNDLIKKHANLPYDAEGTLAAKGQSDEPFVVEVMADPFFEKPLPKSLDRESFAWVRDAVESLVNDDTSLSNALRTLCEITARSIIRGLPSTPSKIILCGGGRKHLLLKKLLQQMTTVPVCDIDDLRINGDFVEAQAWAFLGARHMYKLPYTFPQTTGVRYPTCGGRLLPLD